MVCSLILITNNAIEEPNITVAATLQCTATDEDKDAAIPSKG